MSRCSITTVTGIWTCCSSRATSSNLPGSDHDADARPASSPTLSERSRRRACGTRTLHFTDVTEQSGLDSRGYGMGVAIGDYDGDGCPDVYLTKFGSNQLFHNNCDGTFTDVTIASGTSDSGWSVPAVFFDFDRDGHPDLFVGHYLHYDVEHHTPCFGVSGVPDYCPPGARTPQPNRLFHNNGNGSFTDVTARAGMAADFGGALGAVADDFDGDGWPDLYVANDSRPNQLWINQRNGTFRNTAAGAGAALGSDGLAKASMGVDAGDFDNDGDDDIIVTTLTGQGSNLFVNQGGGLFDEQSARLGIHAPSLPYTGFGTAWFDFDNDGWLDLFSANGLVESRGNTQPISQRMQLFRNLRGRFEDVTDRAGRVFSMSGIGRGAAFGDIDNDGDTDIVVANDNGPARLLVNQVGTRNHWIGLRLVGSDGRREMVGARVECVDGRWVDQVATGSHRRQFRVGRGSARDRRARAFGRFSPRGQSALARRPGGRVDVAFDRPVRHAQGVAREMNSPQSGAWCRMACGVDGAWRRMRRCWRRSGRELTAVSLPDLSDAVTSVQRQIRDEYAALTQHAASAPASRPGARPMAAWACC